MASPYDAMRRALIEQSISAQSKFIGEQSQMDAAFRQGEFQRWIEQQANPESDDEPSDDSGSEPEPQSD